MRPPLVLLLVAAAGTAFFLALNVGSGGRTEPVSMSGGTPGVAPPVDPPNLLRPENPAGVRELADPGTAATRTEHPAARRGNALRGIVLSAELEPVEGARVVLTRYGPDDWILAVTPDARVPDREYRSDAEGRFTFPDLEPGESYTVVANHPEHGRRSEGNLWVADGQISDELRVVLQPGSTLRGVVSDSGGLAIEGARVRLSLMSVGNLEEGVGVLRATTDAAGSYSFVNVSEGHYSLTVQADGFGKTQLQRIAVGRDGDLIQDVSLEVAHLIAGTVHDASTGAAIAGATVEAYSSDRREQATNTLATADGDGKFELDDVRQGSYTLLVQAPGFQPRRIPRVNTGEVDLYVELAPQSKVSGVVLGRDGAPLRDFTVQLRQPMANTTQTALITGTRTEVEDSRDGSFVIPSPRKGEFLVEALHSRYAASFSETFFLDEGADVTGLIIRMTGGGTLVGRLVDDSGSPVAGATVKSHHTDYVDDPFWRSLGDAYPSAAARKEARTGADGTFTLDLLTPESYQIRVSHPDWAPVVVRGLQVEEGSELDLGSIALVEGSSVSGTVYGPSGTGLAGALVQVVLDTEVAGDEHGAFFKARTNAEGRYAFHHLPPGSYKISVQRQGGADNPFVGMTDGKATRRPVTLVDGQSYSQDFTLTN